MDGGGWWWWIDQFGWSLDEFEKTSVLPTPTPMPTPMLMAYRKSSH
jgi:hypothetical protein